MPTTCQFYPHARNIYLRNFARTGHKHRRHRAPRTAVRHEDWIRRLYALFDDACLHGKVFHLWGHSRDIDQFDAWNELDRFLEYAATRIPPRNRLSNGALAERYY